MKFIKSSIFFLLFCQRGLWKVKFHSMMNLNEALENNFTMEPKIFLNLSID